MTPAGLPRPIHSDATPAQVIAAWPADRPLAALVSGAHRPPWSRWSILAHPKTTFCLPAGPAALRPPDPPCPGPTDHGLATGTPHLPPFRGGWLVSLDYELGESVEPAVARAARHQRWNPGSHGPPTATWWWCPDALVHDASCGRWWAIGSPDVSPVLDAAAGGANPDVLVYRLSGLAPAPSARTSFVESARLAVELIRAGDAYQVNLTHRLPGRFAGSARGLFLSFLSRAEPWFGALLESTPATGPARAIVSASPELLFRVAGPEGLVVTRPMKGTRPIEADPQDLAASGKDRAELAMIVDLMRNDLGRVCRFGSVAVLDPSSIEAHGLRGGSGRGVLQASATISGVLRPGAGVADLLAAGFPGGSVTGAPKVRAMQIIRSLEESPRGAYCGAIGYVGVGGDAALSVAIRTAEITGEGEGPGRFSDAGLTYGVGAGIVAESDPAAEWDETLVKARAIRSLTSDAAPPSHCPAASRPCPAAAPPRSSAGSRA